MSSKSKKTVEFHFIQYISVSTLTFNIQKLNQCHQIKSFSRTYYLNSFMINYLKLNIVNIGDMYVLKDFTPTLFLVKANFLKSLDHDLSSDALLLIIISIIFKF